jgi:hypothetical protein
MHHNIYHFGQCMVLHHHRNHTSQQCIPIMVTYRALHFKLEHLFVIPWLHRYINRHVLQSTSFKIIQVINSEQEYFKQHFVNLLYYPHLRIISSVMNVIDIYRFHDWSQFYENLITFLSCQTHPCTIYPCSRYTHLTTLQRFLPSASTFSGVIVFYCFW